jgi:hypothetical protein
MDQQITNTILMVRPADFQFNEQTAGDNEFQHAQKDGNARQLAMAEFDSAVETLRAKAVEVLVVEKQPGYAEMPDAVFPNNWFGTDASGGIHIFPMKTPNRRAEITQLPQVKKLLGEAGFAIKSETNWAAQFPENAILEGTGSLIPDRANKMVYAAISERTNKTAVEIFAARMGYEAILFQTRSSKGFPYYHTNVVMSIGEQMAVVCLECIPGIVERETVKASLLQNHTLITISIEQLEQGFCGNILQVRDGSGKAMTVLSQTAFDSLSQDQKNRMSAFGPLLPIAIPTIEYVGGGSIRCMMAEIFNPKNQ